LRGQVQVQRRRRFAAGHAQRWLRRDDPERSHERAAWWRALKEFKAVCLRGKQLAVRVYSRAAVNNAKRLLQASRGDLPYPPRSIQFDGGSEFRAGFEDACQTLGLPLSVLPPKSPQLNGVAECANGSSRTEFWSLCAGELIIKEAAPALADRAAGAPWRQYQRACNHVRSRCALDLPAPMECLRKHRLAEHAQFHMC